MTSPTSREGKQEDGSQGATFESAAVYASLDRVSDSAERQEADLLATPASELRIYNGNARVIQDLVMCSFPPPSEGSYPHDAESRRGQMWNEFAHYVPQYGTEAEAVAVYNMMRRVTETTPPLTAGLAGLDTVGAGRLKAWEKHFFGPEDPEFVRTEDQLHGTEASYDWHGQPIELTLGSKSQAQPEDAGGSHVQLYRFDKTSWIVRTSAGEMTTMSEEGMLLGRAMDVPSLKRTTSQLGSDLSVSRRHVSLMPQEDGRLRIADSSKFGTRVQEGHWQKREQQPRV